MKPTRKKRRAGRAAAQRGTRAEHIAPARDAQERRPATVAQPRPQSRRRDAAVGALVALVVAAVYVPTTARDLVLGDTPEFIAVAFTLGVAHPPGYPIATLLGHLFSLLPLDPLPFRVNLLSAACGVATAVIIYLTALRLVRDRIAAAVAALVFAFNPLVWRWFLVAEAFPLNNLLSALLIYMLVIWQQRIERAAPLIVAAFVGGLGMANHQTMVLLGPAIVYVLWRGRSTLLRRPWILAACVAAVAVGLLPYAYLPVAAAREPVFDWGTIRTLDDLVAHFLRQSYGTGQLVAQGLFSGGSPFQRILGLFESFTPLEGLLVVLGLAQVYRLRHWFGAFAALAFVVAGPAFAAYANINLAQPATHVVLERFFLLSHVTVAALSAFGVVFATEQAAVWARERGELAANAVRAGAVVAIVAGIAFSYGGVDQSKNRIARRYGEDILATLPKDAIFLANGDDVSLPIAYLQTVEHKRPDVRLIMLGLVRGDWYLRHARALYPDVNFPYAHYDPSTASMRSFVEANQGRTIAYLGDLPDESLKQGYWAYGYGLLELIKPTAVDVELDEMVTENNRLIAAYRPPLLRDVKPGTWERGIVTMYAKPAGRVGVQFLQAGLYREAREWFERALAVDPDLPEIKEAMSKLPR